MLLFFSKVGTLMPHTGIYRIYTEGALRRIYLAGKFKLLLTPLRLCLAMVFAQQPRREGSTAGLRSPIPRSDNCTSFSSRVAQNSAEEKRQHLHRHASAGVFRAKHQPLATRIVVQVIHFLLPNLFRKNANGMLGRLSKPALTIIT